VLAKRVVEGVLLSALVFGVIFFLPNWIFCALVSVFIGFALHEFYNLVARKGIFVYRYFGITAGVLIPVIIYLQTDAGAYGALDPFYIALACFFAFILQFVRRDGSKDHVVSIAVTMFSLLYIAWFLSFFVKIKFLPGGERLVAFLIVATKMNDIGAFFIGRAVGAHALIPRISPKKTIEGTIGGFAVCVLASLASKAYLPDFSYWQLLTLGVLLGTLGHVGDLAESLLKRDCEAKDSGTNLSGLGGIMDVIDSLLFNTPIFYFYLQVIMR
jgi:phosphatidate cytidylyltransferase